MFHGWWLSVVLAAEAVPGGENLVANASFERGQEAPEGWEIFSPLGSALTRDIEVRRSGEASARMELPPAAAAEYPAFKYVLRDVSPGEEYWGRVWARTEAMTDLGGYVVLEFFQDQTRLSFAQGDFTGAGDHDWKELTVRAMVPERTDSLKFSLVAHGVGKVWFDDAELIRVAEAPPEFAGDQLSLRVRPDQTLCPNFLGFGAQGDFFLTCSFNVARGVDEGDRKWVLSRVKAMRPHLLRTLFAYQWWEPEEGRQIPDSEAMRDYLFWVRFLQSLGTDVLLTPWGDYFAYSDWLRAGTDRLPPPEKRAAMVRSLVDLVAFLRRREGLKNVKYLCLMNEPDNDPTRPVAVDEFVRLNRLLDQTLRERGLRDEVFLLGADDCSGGPLEASAWFRQVVAQGVEYCDGLSVHTYKHEYTPGLAPWLQQRKELLREIEPDRPPKPILITEFGYGGETFKNWENHRYEYGLFLADFAITALREGASAALMWCLMDTYYSDRDEHQQQWGLWRYRDQRWEPRPGFYSWSLLTRYTRPGSRVVAVDVDPPAHAVRAVALVSPEGALTLLAANRYQRPLKITMEAGLDREAPLRLYRYTRESIPVPGGGMIDASDTLRVSPGSELELDLPAESFVLLTEMD